MRPLILSIPLISVILMACGQSGQDAAEPDSQPPVSSDVVADEPEIGLVSDGQMIVEDNCTSCHAIGASDESPRLDAPPLRTVLIERDVEALRDDFREGIHVGAIDMPDFDFGPLGTDAVIAYIESIQVETETD